MMLSTTSKNKNDAMELDGAGLESVQGGDSRNIPSARVFVMQGPRDSLSGSPPSSSSASSSSSSSSLESHIVSFPHPRTGTAQYLLTSDQRLCEIQCGSAPGGCSSWFVGSTVQADGTLYMASDIDPLFVLLPLLETSRQKGRDNDGFYKEFPQMLSEHENRQAFIHMAAWDEKKLMLDLICDSQEIMDDIVYRLNDDKVVRWLRVKLRHVENALSGLPSTECVSRCGAEDEGDKLSKDELRVHSLQWISEYIDDVWLERLATESGVSMGDLEEKPLSSTMTVADFYGANNGGKLPTHTGINGSSSAVSAPSKQIAAAARRTSANKQLDKVDTRKMGSMMSFFKKVPKK